MRAAMREAEVRLEDPDWLESIVRRSDGLIAEGETEVKRHLELLPDYGRLVSGVQDENRDWSQYLRRRRVMTGSRLGNTDYTEKEASSNSLLLLVDESRDS